MEADADLAAIQAGIDDMEAGRVVPFEQVDARLRAKLGLPPRRIMVRP
jgi:predicted transcriptional regulator